MQDLNSDNTNHPQRSTVNRLSNKEKISVWLPFVLAFMMAIGIMIGLLMRPQTGYFETGKLDEILNFIDARYIDKTDRENLEDAAIEALLKKLDPHSSYIPKKKLQGVNESLQGNFDGIGVEFLMLEDTIVVVGVVKSGPAEKSGVRIGDRIIRVNDSIIAGVGLKSTEVTAKIKGKSGSAVKLDLLQRGDKKLKAVNITRGQIPMKSVEVAYMLDEKTGYIKISRFSDKTFKEFMIQFENLIEKNKMQDLIIDLRDNPGGYLNEATDILNQLFEDKRLLVYTEGRSYKKKEYKSNAKPYFKIGKIAILINEGSASASEIIAGAIQDNDRGLIVGRRSYGKGLVQEQYELGDSSAIRLTVAKYYTPSKRLIQKPYKAGEEDEYENDIEKRYINGELINKDSIKISDSTEYKTVGGRIVYGGGGIIPDIFVPLDTVLFNEYYQSISALIPAYVNRFMDQQFKEFAIYKSTLNFADTYQVKQVMLEDFHTYALKKLKVAKNERLWTLSKEKIAINIKGQIAQQLFGEEGLYRCINQKDKDILKALSELKRK
jgi:carboxyl-terminal processing protease